MKCVTRYILIPHLKKSLMPVLLCSYLSRPNVPGLLSPKSLISSPKRQYQSTLAAKAAKPDEEKCSEHSHIYRLPWTCPGCGAYTQLSDPGEAGFYSSKRKAVRVFASPSDIPVRNGSLAEAKTFNNVVACADQGLLQNLGLEHVQGAIEPYSEVPATTPVCDRCHDLLHHHKGASIVHPSLQSIQDMFAESPHSYNHIYHVLDAADFPLSLIPSLQRHLSLLPQRSHNRRSKTDKFYPGQKPDMSFIITRSDLLAPQKQQVDALMPYLLQILREALGALGKGVRLGNVRCVSSRRGWWTRELKEDIWKRGGGGWMVGKVNVGKSNLFEAVFPKGRNEEVSYEALQNSILRQSSVNEGPEAQPPSGLSKLHSHQIRSPSILSQTEESEDLQHQSLLPSASRETAFPVMPTISSLPGTTVSPIRLPFGNGRGELIDLPGLARGNLESYVRDGHKKDLVMQRRIKAEQLTIKPDQSLLIGGLIRITPKTPDVVLLASPFVPLQCHVTSTVKAVAVHTQKILSGVPTITNPFAGRIMASAGIFELPWDVTRQRAGPLTAPSAVGLKPEVLPFVIYSIDILIEGCGWIELAMQVRKRTLQSLGGRTTFPAVEVFSPEGKYIGARRPLNAWMLGGNRPLPANKRKARPRRSMKGVKKNMKRTKQALAYLTKDLR